jgi:altronate hydrolase
MTPASVIRLHPDDGVLIARSSLPPGMVVIDGVTTV